MQCSREMHGTGRLGSRHREARLRCSTACLLQVHPPGMSCLLLPFTSLCRGLFAETTSGRLLAAEAAAALEGGGAGAAAAAGDGGEAGVVPEDIGGWMVHAAGSPLRTRGVLP